MKWVKWLLVILISSLAGVWAGLCITEPVRAEAPPPSSAQQRPDIFPCNGCVIQDADGDGDGDMQDLNPTNRKAKQTRSLTYRVRLISGCNYGNYDAILSQMQAEASSKVGLTLARNDTFYDFTVYISCGLVQINKCGSVNVFCLPDGFPYNTDVYMSDVLSGWDAGSQKGISLHEIVGHAAGTWNEQYQACGSSCGFAPTPNLRSFMNTGSLSRIGIEADDCGRWMRTMWQDVPCAALYGYAETDCTGETVDHGNGLTATWDTCLNVWVFSNGYTWSPFNGWWGYRDVGFSPCDAQGLRQIPAISATMPGLHSIYVWAYGYWLTVPGCF